LQTQGIKPSDLDNQKTLLGDKKIQSFAEGIVNQLFSSQDLGKVLELARSAGQNQFGNTGYTGEEIANLISVAGGANKVKELTGFGMDFNSLFTSIETSMKDLGVIVNNQISLQKDAQTIIQNQNTLITESANKLAQALEGIPETIKVQITGIETIDITLTKNTAEEDMNLITKTVKDQVVEYIKRALETSGVTINSLGAPGGI
jgi:hypothetical protein